MKKYILLTSVIMLAVFATATLAIAKPTVTYDVTSNYHGIDTPLGANVIVTATTTDPDVVSVVFIWHDATGTEQWRETVPVNSGQAQCSSKPGEPSSLGDWGVQAYFVATSGGHSDHDIDHIVSQKATSFMVVTQNVVPEVPILGTAGIAGAMAIGLAAKLKRKNVKL